MAGYVDYKSANSVPSGGPSPEIWADCPVVTILRDPGKGIHMFEDFTGYLTTLSAAGQAGPHFQLVGTNPVIKIHEDNDDLGGAVDIEGGGTKDDEAYLVSNIVYELKKENHKKMWFEAKIKFEDADADQAFICGLGEASLLAADAIADDSTGVSTTADYDFVGFFTDCDGTNMDNIDAVYGEDGDGALTDVDTNVVTITAGTTTYDDTYIRLGMKYDGESTVTFYVDGVATGTTLDVDDFATNTADELDPLGVIVGKKDLAGAANHVVVDWIRFACEK